MGAYAPGGVSAGSVTPAKISTTVTDDFTLPRDLTITRNLITGGAPTIIKPTADSTAAIKITEADGSTVVMAIDTQNRRVGIGVSTPNQLFVVAGNTRIDGVLSMGPSTASAACLIDMVNPFVGCGMPVMTTIQKTAISPNRAGNVVYDTDLGKLCVNTGSGWQTITSA